MSRNQQEINEYRKQIKTFRWAPPEPNKLWIKEPIMYHVVANHCPSLVKFRGWRSGTTTTLLVYNDRHQRITVVTDKEVENISNETDRMNCVGNIMREFIYDLYAYYVIGD